MGVAKRVLVFQHVAVEHPGVFRQFLAEDGHEIVVVELDAGEKIPSLDGFDALWVMGGAMDVWQEAEHPWLTLEKAAIREAVIARQLPYLGFCLGHQLLADVLGGEVRLAAESEVGIMEVECTAAGQTDPFLAGIPASLDVLQWHGAEVARPPPGSSILARSARCENQAMRVGSRAFSIQFHVEITLSTVTEWNAIPEYNAALIRILGADGAQHLVRKAELCMPTFNGHARQLYANWKAVTGFG
ncbi:MAG: type 1 glutamine amidotransferase [Gammaproteobacteria bacterium]|nr:type 1 glutamine amidotransferase [Gammaproteobacteria bacterium]